MTEEAARNYKGAFECAKCPGTANSLAKRSCPMWWETVMTSPESGETRIERSCGYTQLPLFLIEVIKASNRPAAVAESTRNEIVKGFDRLTLALPRLRG